MVGIIVGSGIDVVRVCTGLKGFRSLSGDRGAAWGGTTDVGVVEALGETAAEEK